MIKNKAHLKLIVIGHIDCGKSTTIGHLLYLFGQVSEKQLTKNENEGIMIGYEKVKYSWVVDQLNAERERSMTINISIKKFESSKYHYSIIDSPGHRDYIGNMIKGVSQADLAILVVSAEVGEYEAGMCSEGQTREHVLIAYTMGIKQIIVAINKMDAIEYNQERFNFIKFDILKFLQKFGFKEPNINFVPYCAYSGENMSKKSLLMSWHEGDTLVETLEKLDPPKLNFKDKPLRLPLLDVYKISGIGTVPVGRIATGTLKPGMIIIFTPSNIVTECKIVEMHYENLDEGNSGDIVGFNIRGVGIKDLRRGFVVGDAKNNPPKEAVSFISEIIVLNHPNTIKAGYTPVVDCHTCHIACKFDKLISKRKTGKELELEPKEIKNNEAALVKLIPQKPMVVEKFEEYPPLGRIVIRDIKKVIAVGIIKEVEKKEKTNMKANLKK
jgi:elongation factor 1-alpha